MGKQLILICFLLLSFVNPGISQEKIYPSIPLNGNTIYSFIPENYFLLDSAWGDFNNDAELDFAIIVEGRNSIIENRGDELYPDSTEEFPRILIICFKTNTGFQLVERSNSFILRKTEGGMFGDPYAGMNINKKGVLEIDFYSGSNWRWSYQYKFRYQDGEFKLIGGEHLYYFNVDGQMQSWSCNFLTNRMKYIKGNMFEDSVDEEFWYNLEFKELKTFKTFFKPMSWEITKDLTF